MLRSGQRRSADDYKGSQMLLRTRIVRATAIGALALAAPALSSCSFSTDKVYTPAPGANDRSERVDVLNAVIVSTAPDSGTLVVTLANNDTVAIGEPSGSADKALVDVSGGAPHTPGQFENNPAPAELKAAELPEPIVIASGDYTRIANMEDNIPEGAGTAVDGIKVTGTFEAGQFVTVTFTFDSGNPVTLQVPVVHNNGQWAGQDGETLTPVDPEIDGAKSDESN